MQSRAQIEGLIKSCLCVRLAKQFSGRGEEKDVKDAIAIGHLLCFPGLRGECPKGKSGAKVLLMVLMKINVRLGRTSQQATASPDLCYHALRWFRTSVLTTAHVIIDGLKSKGAFSTALALVQEPIDCKGPAG